MHLRSTGPKQRSNLNAYRHGLTGQTVVISEEDQKHFEAFCTGFFNDYQPEGSLEIQLVQNIATCFWRLNRIAAHEETLLSLDTLAGENQIDNADARVRTACAAARAFEMHSKRLAYEQRLSKRLETACKQLKQAQAERKQQQEDEFHRAAILKQHHDEMQANEPQPVPYNPANDGFVFSNGALESNIARKERYHVALDAYYSEEEEAAA